MKKPLMLKCTSFVFLLALSQAAMAKSVGTVTFSAGDVTISHADKTVTKAEKNAELNAGDAIETKEGRVQLSMIDGGKISLQPNTIYKINQFEFTGKEDGSEYNFTELVKGGLRTISGLIGHKNRDHYQLKTAVATIGIRGTEFTVNFNDNILLMTTNHGSVDVCNAGGCLNAITGQSIQVVGIGGAPKPSNKAAKAAVTAPDSAKPIFTTSEKMTEEGVPVIVTTAALAAQQAAANALKSTTTSGSAMVLAFKSGIAGAEQIVSSATNTFDASGNLTQSVTATNINVTPMTFSSFNSTDGIIAWGRADAGNHTVSGQNYNMDKVEYIAGTTPVAANLANLSGTYTVFGSTAPFLDVAGVKMQIGNANSTGTFNFNFGANTYNYNLQVQTLAFTVGTGPLATGFAAQTFSLTNSGVVSLSSASPVFSNAGNVNSQTAGSAICSAGCGGALSGGNLVQGAFFGINGERVGIQYGFSVPAALATVYGGVVLK